ncbi:MAG: hypothetical protein JWQ04_201 [Pedosphaera sp.]|nr:hypothetical protein [Pedosphaera sp.]
MSKNQPTTLLPISGWIVVCAFLNCGGWLLSAVHQLNLLGYSVAGAGGALAAAFWWKTRPSRPAPGCWRTKLRRRFRRSFPRAFLVLALLTFLGGAIHAPNNYDGLAYRLPRILNWLAEGQWHWIHTDFQRLNVRACGIEWISAPLILFFRTDRLLFLINTVSFLLLPGLFFSVFTRLGIRPRAAWHWMWLLPTGYSFLLQAGSIGNDLFAAVFGLAALDFALRAKDSGRISDLWLSALAAALLTGGKTSNCPLLLPWLIALLPSLGLIRKRLLATAAVGAVAAVASFLPMAAINVKQCGDWTGQAAEQATFMTGHPMLHVAQNSALLVIQNLVPPVFPLASTWNREVMKIIPTGLMHKLEDNFEPSGAHYSLPELQMEEDAGLGFGVSLLLLLTFACTRFLKPAAEARSRPPGWRLYQAAILAGAVVSVLPFMWVSGSTTTARLLTPYYGLLVPLFLLRQSGDWIRRNTWWRYAGLLVFLIAGLTVIISPARPLWPAGYVLSKLDHGGSALIKRAETVYAVYGQRGNGFAPVTDQLPADATVLGLITFDDPETSLWLPFGQRRIVHVKSTDRREDLDRRGIKYVLVSSEFLSWQPGQTPQSWAEKNHAEIIRVVPLTLRASRGPVDWAVARLRPDGTKGL